MTPARPFEVIKGSPLSVDLKADDDLVVRGCF